MGSNQSCHRSSEYPAYTHFDRCLWCLGLNKPASFDPKVLAHQCV
ncbi:Uncharacterised protein [Vibrio cholerae]|nr:Uncharacterised protein [Vibrio cholerae]